MTRLGSLGRLAGLLALLGGCSPNYGDGGFACSSGPCPSGYRCADEGGKKICRKEATSALDAAPKTEGAPPNPCLKQADGTDCSPTGGKGFVCRAEQCVASSCGDGFVDKNQEDCDDSNSVPDDGCNACKFNCKAGADCDDQNPCTAESCDATAHQCNSASVTDGKDCVLGSFTGACHGGTCAPKSCGNGIKESGEECDDGNKVGGDGCNNNCQYSCHDSKADCDDKNICTGEEKCDPTTHKCLPGTPLNCADPLPCTTDTCDPVAGCQHTPIDADKDGHAAAPCGDDCNDNDPAMHPGLIDCVDGKDNDCDKNPDPDPTIKGICWKDVDGDGFAALGAATFSGCSCPAGYVNRDPSQAGNADCMAQMADVNPGQTKYFTSSYCRTGCSVFPCVCLIGNWSYDFNCDNNADQQYKGLAGTCTPCVGKYCLSPCSGSGWVGATIPACGVTAKYRNCVSGILGGCAAKEADIPQGCR